MKILIIVDPAFHMEESSEAVFYQDKGGYRLHRLRSQKFKGKMRATAAWCAELKAQYPEADFKIEDNGPGLAIISEFERLIA